MSFETLFSASIETDMRWIFLNSCVRYVELLGTELSSYINIVQLITLNQPVDNHIIISVQETNKLKYLRMREFQDSKWGGKALFRATNLVPN